MHMHDPDTDADTDRADVAAEIKDAFGAEFDKAAGAADEAAPPAAGKPAAPAAAAPAQQAAQAAPERFAAPHRWTPAAKAAWEALHGYEGATDHMRALHEQQRQIDAYMTQQDQARVGMERQWQPIADVIQPFAQQWAQQGMSVDQGLRQLTGYAQALAENPQQTIMQLAEMYGVDLRAALDEQPWVDPVLQQAQTRLQQLESRLAAQDEHAQRAQREGLVQAVRSFADATDEQGNLKHPYFEDDRVFDDMLKAVSMGWATTPEQAYEMVVNYHPEIRAQVQADNKRRADAAAVAAAQRTTATTQRAKGASGTVKGGTAGAGATPSAKEKFFQNYEQAAAR